MTEPKKPVFWYQGLFLQPQHFQQADLFHQSSLGPLRDYLQPFFFGTCGHTIDEGALREMVFNLSHGEFLFQDGTWVKTTENAKLQARSFKDAWTNMDKPFKVFIGLKRWDHGGKNVAAPGSGEVRSRYSVDETQSAVKDVYLTDNIAEVKLLHHVLKFFWENETADSADYHLMPLAILTFNARMWSFPATTLHPPSCFPREPLVRPCAPFRNWCSPLPHPRGVQKPQGFQQADLQAAYLNFFLALHTLNRYCPSSNISSRCPRCPVDGVRAPETVRRRAQLLHRPRRCLGRLANAHSSSPLTITRTSVSVSARYSCSSRRSSRP